MRPLSGFDKRASPVLVNAALVGYIVLEFTVVFYLISLAIKVL